MWGCSKNSPVFSEVFVVLLLILSVILIVLILLVVLCVVILFVLLIVLIHFKRLLLNNMNSRFNHIITVCSTNIY